MSGVLPTTPFKVTAFGTAQTIVSSGVIPVGRSLNRPHPPPAG